MSAPSKKSLFSVPKATKLSDLCSLEEPSVLTPQHLGGKAYGCATMAAAGVAVPQGIVIPTDWCTTYREQPEKVLQLIAKKAPLIEAYFQEKTGFPAPLISVRSGAPISMPGMLDTVLNVGLTKENLPSWKQRIGDRAALDSYRRLQHMFGSVVYQIPDDLFERALESLKKSKRIQDDKDLNLADLEQLITTFDAIYEQHGKKLPQSFCQQLLEATQAVFLSWNNPRAQTYRKINAISESMGTAVLFQRMIFGNLNDLSASGVLFTRNPATGKKAPMGEFLPCAQGEDVVAGVRTPEPIENLQDIMPSVYEQLMQVAQKLEQKFADVQDIEFTIENQSLYILQTRKAKRSALANLKIALDMVQEGLIEKKQVLERLSFADYQALGAPMIAPGFGRPAEATGLAASIGIASGVVAFSSQRAVQLAAEGKSVILLRPHTTPDDLPGMHAATGILTATGGVTSHAAVVARGMNKVCIVGADSMQLLYSKRHEESILTSVRFKNGITITEGDTLTLDGASGRIWTGQDVPVIYGDKLPQLQALHDLLYDVYPVYRIATNGRELHSDYKMIYATYGLDYLPQHEIKTEIKESLPYLNGVLDLTCASAYHGASDKALLDLMGITQENPILKTKIQALQEYTEDKSNFSVYLGSDHDTYAKMLLAEGYSLCAHLPKAPTANPKDNALGLVIDQHAQKITLAQLEKNPQALIAVQSIECALLEALHKKTPPPSEGTYEQRYPLAINAKALAKTVLK